MHFQARAVTCNTVSLEVHMHIQARASTCNTVSLTLYYKSRLTVFGLVSQASACSSAKSTSNPNIRPWYTKTGVQAWVPRRQPVAAQNLRLTLTYRLGIPRLVSRLGCPKASACSSAKSTSNHKNIGFLYERQCPGLDALLTVVVSLQGAQGASLQQRKLDVYIQESSQIFVQIRLPVPQIRGFKDSTQVRKAWCPCLRSQCPYKVPKAPACSSAKSTSNHKNIGFLYERQCPGLVSLQRV